MHKTIIRTCILTAIVNEDDMSDPNGFVNTSLVRFIEHALKQNKTFYLIHK